MRSARLTGKVRPFSFLKCHRKEIMYMIHMDVIKLKTLLFISNLLHKISTALLNAVKKFDEKCLYTAGRILKKHEDCK